MDVENALSTLAEVAIAITGFAGVVAVFGRRSSGHWTAAEGNRLTALIVSSLTALFLCVLPFLLLSIPVSEATCWRVLSFVVVVSRIAFMTRLFRIVGEARRVPEAEREVSLVVSALFLAGDLVTIALLLANAFWLAAVWPYLAAIIWLLAQASITFARLILVPVSRSAA